MPRPGSELSITHPQISLEMVRPARSTPAHLTAGDVTAGSGYYFVWSCGIHRHEWEARVGDRTRGTGCPECARMTAAPSQASQRPASPVTPDTKDEQKSAGGVRKAAVDESSGQLSPFAREWLERWFG